MTQITVPDTMSVALLVAEVQQLRSEVRQMLDRLPDPGRTWLEPREIAAIVGVSTRTISSWRTAGRFRDESIRPTNRGWQFHVANAVSDIRRIR